MKDAAEVRTNGFFVGYTVWTWLVIFAQATGGLLVAMVVKYADNILKGFATSISILISSLVSVFLFDFQLTVWFLTGSLFVVMATYLYERFPGSINSSKV
jgi:UDP-sugar transporter A1/2/3